jgi:hypothetical protein
MHHKLPPSQYKWYDPIRGHYNFGPNFWLNKPKLNNANMVVLIGQHHSSNASCKMLQLSILQAITSMLNPAGSFTISDWHAETFGVTFMVSISSPWQSLKGNFYWECMMAK